MELYDMLIDGAKSALVRTAAHDMYIEDKQTAFMASIAQSVLAIALMTQEERNAKEAQEKA